MKLVRTLYRTFVAGRVRVDAVITSIALILAVFDRFAIAPAAVAIRVVALRDVEGWIRANKNVVSNKRKNWDARRSTCAPPW